MNDTHCHKTCVAMSFIYRLKVFVYGISFHQLISFRRGFGSASPALNWSANCRTLATLDRIREHRKWSCKIKTAEKGTVVPGYLPSTSFHTSITEQILNLEKSGREKLCTCFCF